MKSLFYSMIALYAASGAAAHAYSLQTYAAGLKDRGALEYYDPLNPTWSWSDNKLTYKIDTSVLGNLGNKSYTATEITTLTAAIESQFLKWQQWGNLSFSDFTKEPPGSTLDVNINFIDNRGEDILATNGILDPGEDVNHNGKLDLGDIVSSTIISTPNVATMRLTAIDYQKQTADLKFTSALDYFKRVVLHETGHVLGVADLYEYKNVDKPAYEDYIDHGLNQRPVASAKGKADNIMQDVYHDINIIDNDEIAALTWLWGNKFDQIVTGRLSKLLDDLKNTKQAQHHGPDQNPLNTWYYRGTIKTIGMSTIELYAYGVAKDNAECSPGTWEYQFDPNKVTIKGTPANHGNFECYIKSPFPEGFINAAVNTSLFNQAINQSDVVYLMQGGVEKWPVVYGPVPGPLPILGAAASFKFSRKIRKRIAAARMNPLC